MGQACTTNRDNDDTDWEQHMRSDATGKRRLSVITLPKSEAKESPEEKLPPTVTSHMVRKLERYNCVMDVFGMSCAGTYARESYKENQDDYFVHEIAGNVSNGALFSVMDGHGVAGRQASSFVSRTLASLLLKEADLPKAPQDVIRKAFVRSHADLRKSPVDCSCSGTTCVLAYVHENRVVCANAGDSRCVLGVRNDSGQYEHRDLSHDHKPDNPGERARIERHGGRVEPMRGALLDPIGPARVWVGREMYPGLAMSRSIGDTIAQSVGVSCEPDFEEYELDLSRPTFMILASDGVWEFIESEEAVSLVSSEPNAAAAAKRLCQESLKRWAKEEDVCDDITAVVVWFVPEAEFGDKAAIEAAEGEGEKLLPNGNEQQ